MAGGAGGATMTLTEMADRMRGSHQRDQTPTRAQPLPLQGRCRNEAPGRVGVIADNGINIGHSMEKQLHT
jgi:hypothetical protein